MEAGSMYIVKLMVEMRYANLFGLSQPTDIDLSKGIL